MDISTFDLMPAIYSILSLASIVVSGYCTIWAVGKVISLAKDDTPTHSYDPDPFDYDYGPPSAHSPQDYDPNGNYFRRDGMWRKYEDFR